ncbi:glutathione S-transferase theta-3 isoform X2 [Eurytemora carolleeae]|uniref:glutathione S-transferase theta-3 isoform X2 n=1 Tax=Eurytemora carolleeae TaxID=1294199 RepID=UPI000C755FBE|nr:glutathione S-transferase theta-3 isoform X2 [Eurytemora carolleeae]|eukprot:XP_023331921.1 glutathione S-transferase theta-3-like isoform X2 [Eurytemora affinis]
MSVKVYADLMSQPARAIVLFCRAAGVPHEHIPIRIAKGEHTTDEYTTMNPLQKIPVIKDGDFTLTESVAMFRYLAREKDIADHWYPKCAGYFRARWLIPILKQKQPNEKLVAQLRKGMEECLDTIEKTWLKEGNQKFMCGDTISVADILAACELEQPSMAGYDVRKDRPILSSYMTRVKDILNPHYDEVHTAVYKMTKKFGGKIPGVTDTKEN